MSTHDSDSSGRPARRPDQDEGAAFTQRDSACAYVPLTGPVPDGLAPGEPFTHYAVEMTPALARELLARYATTSRPLRDQEVERWMGVIESSRTDPEFTSIHDYVHVARTGETIAGQHLLHAVMRADVTVSVDVVHNSERSRP